MVFCFSGPKNGTVLGARFRPQTWVRFCILWTKRRHRFWCQITALKMGPRFTHLIRNHIKQVKVRSHFGCRNLAPKTVPLLDTPNAKTISFLDQNLAPQNGSAFWIQKKIIRPMQCGSGTTFVPPEYLQETHRSTSMLTRHRCVCFRKEKKGQSSS